MTVPQTNLLLYHDRYNSLVARTAMSLHNILDTDFEPYCGQLEHYTHWKWKTDERFILAKGAFQDFVNRYVPSSAPYKPLAPGAMPITDLTICREVIDPRDKCLPLVRVWTPCSSGAYMLTGRVAVRLMP